MGEGDRESAPFLTDNLRRNGEVWQLNLDRLPTSPGRNAEDARAGDGNVGELHQLRAVGRLDGNQLARGEPFSGAVARPLDTNEAEHDEDNEIVPGPSQRGTRIVNLVRSPVHVEGPQDRRKRQDDEDDEGSMTVHSTKP